MPTFANRIDRARKWKNLTISNRTILLGRLAIALRGVGIINDDIIGYVAAYEEVQVRRSCDKHCCSFGTRGCQADAAPGWPSPPSPPKYVCLGHFPEYQSAKVCAACPLDPSHVHTLAATCRLQAPLPLSAGVAETETWALDGTARSPAAAGGGGGQQPRGGAGRA